MSRPPTGGRRRRRGLLVLALAGGLLVCGATLAGILWYANATAPDRSAPDVTADNYLRALLVERDDTRASLWACGDRSALAEIEVFRGEVSQREARLGQSITVSWGPLTVAERSGGTATVNVDLRQSAIIDGTLQSVTDNWRLQVVEDGGWRVCAARRTPR